MSSSETASTNLQPAAKSQEILQDEAEYGVVIDVADMQRSIGSKPRPPSPSACCGEGCKNCVMDMYDQRLDRWMERKRKYLEELKRKQAEPQP